MSDPVPLTAKERLSQTLLGTATAFLVIYGAFLVFLILRTGLPLGRVFSEHDSDIPALTEITMQPPIWVWPAVYGLCCLLCATVLTRKRRGWKLNVFGTAAACAAALFLYAGYFGLLVLPGMKLMMRYTN
jgi:hypothetical protein